MKNSVTAYSRGHAIYWNDNTREWYYEDDDTLDTDSRPCIKCKCYPTKEGHDACIPTLPDTAHACCGHGVEEGYRLREDGGKRLEILWSKMN